jgi:hypothetical protein
VVTLDVLLCAVVAIWDALLFGASWRYRAVLPGLTAAAGIPVIVFAVASGVTQATAQAALVIAAIFQVIGTVLLVGGERIERLLSGRPEPTAEPE